MVYYLLLNHWLPSLNSRRKDKNNTGVLPAQELRNAINSVLKINMTDKQFDELIQQLSEKADNGKPQINYGTLLNLFNSE